MFPKWRTGIVFLVVVLAALAGGGYWWYRRTEPPPPPAVDTSGREPEIAAAIEEAQTQVRRQPRSGDTWGRLGMVLLAHAFEAEGDACLAQAERLSPNEPRWPYYRALLKELRDPEAALPLLRRAAELAHDTSVPRLHWAEVLLNQGHRDEAAAEFRRVLREEPGNPRAELGLGRLLYQQGDLDGSLPYLNRSAAGAPGLRATHALLAEIYHRRKQRRDEERELAFLNESQDLDWPDPYRDELMALQLGVAARLERAERLAREGRKEEAIGVLREAVQAKPNSYQARLQLARRLLRAGNTTEAEEHLQAALRVNADSFEVLAELGVLWQKRGKFRKAAECYERVLALQPSQAMAHFHLANCREQLGDRAGAITSLRAAVRCKPEFALAHKVLGRLLAEMNQNAEAAEQLRQALRLQPDDAQTRELLKRVTEKRSQKKSG